MRTIQHLSIQLTTNLNPVNGYTVPLLIDPDKPSLAMFRFDVLPRGIIVDTFEQESTA